MAMESTRNVLSAVDYVIFTIMLLISAGIGVFFGYKDRKSKTGTEGYLMANRSMSVVPVAISISASFQSCITLLGVPADVYFYGLGYVWMIIGVIPACFAVSIAFHPVLYNLRISSVFEYLERRYNKALRIAMSMHSIVQTLFYCAVNIYAPALALSEVTGFALTTAMLSTALVCIFYTTLGGLRGVIWADVFQALIMTTGLLSIIIQGTIKIGGFHEVWRIAEEGGRTSSRYELDPRLRYSAWSGLFGGSIFWLAVFGTSQAQVQRMLSVKSERNSYKALWLGGFGIITYTMLALTGGLVVYAYYSDCDPLSNNCITKRDELMPYSVMEFFRDHQGMPGLFLACLYSASMSTVSSALNGTVTVLVEDYIKPFTKWTDQRHTRVSKGLTFVLGVCALGLSFVASIAESILDFSLASGSTFMGPSLGIFLLGIWFPFANAVGAFCGYLSGVVIALVMFIGSMGISVPDHIGGKLPVSTRFCPVNCSYMDYVNLTEYDHQDSFLNITQENTEEYTELEGVDNFFATSFLYVAAMGLATSLSVGILMSLLTGGWKERNKVNKRLIMPPFEAKIFRCIPENIRRVLRCGISWEIKDLYEADESEVKELARKDEKIETEELNGINSD